MNELKSEHQELHSTSVENFELAGGGRGGGSRSHNYKLENLNSEQTHFWQITITKSISPLNKLTFSVLIEF